MTQNAFPSLSAKKIKANIKLFEQTLIPYAEKTEDCLALHNMKASVNAWTDELKRRGE